MHVKHEVISVAVQPAKPAADGRALADVPSTAERCRRHDGTGVGSSGYPLTGLITDC